MLTCLNYFALLYLHILILGPSLMPYSFIKYLSHMYINGALCTYCKFVKEHTSPTDATKHKGCKIYIDISLHPNLFLVSVNILYLFMPAHFLYLYAQITFTINTHLTMYFLMYLKINFLNCTLLCDSQIYFLNLT